MGGKVKGHWRLVIDVINEQRGGYCDVRGLPHRLQRVREADRFICMLVSLGDVLQRGRGLVNQEDFGFNLVLSKYFFNCSKLIP